MSLNLGNAVMQACANLRGDTNFEMFRAGFADMVHTKINAALESPPEARIEATSYARALRDTFIAIEAATLGLQQRVTTLPKTKVGVVT